MYETEGSGAPQVLGDELRIAMEEAEKNGSKAVKTGRWRPHRAVNIRGGVRGLWRVMNGEQEIGTLSGYHQFRDAYPRAIYMHGGTSYRVDSIEVTGDGGNVNVSPTERYLRTRPSIFTIANEMDIYDGQRWEADGVVVEAMYGKVSITEVLNRIEEIDERSGEVIDQWTPDGNQAQHSNAHACWIRLDAEEFASENNEDAQPVTGIAELQHLLRLGALFTAPIDAHDVYPYAVLPEQKVYIVESYPGGIGIARKVLDKWREMLEFGVELADDCECSRGCPSCIVPPRSRDDLDKRLGLALAEKLLDLTRSSASHQFANGLWRPVSTFDASDRYKQLPFE